MPGKIFFNYRRDDDPGYTQALYQRLEDEFAPADLFMDVEGSIKPGDDFVEVLGAQVSACDVMLAIIGPRWSELLADRLNDPADFVAIELKTAFAIGKRVIPVLVGGASIPRADELPEAIRPLARRNAVGLRPERFKADCQGLVTALQEQLAGAEKERAARTETERAAAEADRLKREAEEAARIVAAEERARSQRVAGMSPEEVRKAEELANWDFIKERDRPQELQDHLARFPGGVTTRYARARLEELVWDGIAFAPTAPTVETLQAFLNEFPDGKNADEARTLLADLGLKAVEAKLADEQRRQETEAWVRVAASTEFGQIESFLSQWPSSHYANAARARIAELKPTPWTRRHALLLSAAIVVAFLLGAGTVAWHLDIWGKRVNNTVPAKAAKAPPKPVPVERSIRETEAPNRAIEPPGDFEPPPPWWQLGLKTGAVADETQVEGDHPVRLRRRPDGHFIARARANGVALTMLLDTGASTVVLKPEDAQRLGIESDKLRYTVPVQTANGTTYAAHVRLRTLALGPISLDDVEALVARPNALKENLLGMSFLGRLRSYELTGDIMTLRGGEPERTASNAIERIAEPQPPAVGEPAPTQIKTQARVVLLDPGAGTEHFKDCPTCPEMVAVPAGVFTMGSPESEPERNSDEVQVGVTIPAPFAVGRYAVTFDEWDACVNEGGCNGYTPAHMGWGRGKRPVINVNWDDAEAYTLWLSRKIGKTYRLLSETEREYVTRAGTTTPFWWGSTITPTRANYNGSAEPYKGGGAKGEYLQRTVPVDSFEPNAWGLYNVHGNVWEYTEDCWNASNTGNPGDGSARMTGDCDSRVVRGGAWNTVPQALRSAIRNPGDTILRYSYLGFRVVRTLAP
jgi:clan AA aspartic protease (TIGR02281 family)